MKEGVGKTVVRFLIWCLLYIATAIVGNIVGSITNSDEIMSWTMLLGFVLLTVFYLVKQYVKLSFGGIERNHHWPAVGVSVALAATYVFVQISLFSLFDIENLFSNEIDSLNKTGQHLFQGIAGLLFGCIFCPILEEIGFRGILLGGLLKSGSRPWVAILISAIVFALFHGVGVKFVGSLVFAVFVGWLYWRTGSIILCMIVHIVNNSLSFIDLTGQSDAVCLLILVGCLLLLALGIWWFAKKCSVNSCPPSTPA